MRVDLPEPEMPVRTVRRPSGMAAVTFLRLFARAAGDGEEGVGLRDGAAGAAGGVGEGVGEGAESGGVVE